MSSLIQIQQQHIANLMQKKIEQNRQQNILATFQIDDFFDTRINKPGPKSWTLFQHKTYLSFMKQHAQKAQKLMNGEKRPRIFQQLSKIMKTRTPNQIKSRHQKLQKKYKNIYNIIAYLQILIPTLEPCSVPCQAEDKNTQPTIQWLPYCRQYPEQMQFMQEKDQECPLFFQECGSNLFDLLQPF